MSLSTFLESLPADQDSAALVRQLERLHLLSEWQFERGLGPEELQELLSLRVELRNRLASWLQKR